MVQPSSDFKERANKILDVVAAGIFFQENHPKLLPTFDRWNTNKKERQEFTLGETLGKGAYCFVSEITDITLTRPQNGNTDADGTTSSLDLNSVLNTTSNDDVVLDETDFPVELFRNTDEMRKYMSQYCLREDDGGKHARYALKQLKPTNDREKLEQGLIDISIEAKFLSCINHPNIIKMRGIAGEPLSPNFALVLDRLYMTLQEQMEQWAADRKVATASRWGICGCYFGTVDEIAIAKQVFSALTVAYDLSCALRHIHSCNLLYRDIKPENAGFDVRGTIKLFDFGFCKELRKDLFDEKSGGYNLTIMTGSAPYMAPENLLGKPYGTPADVFSFGVLVWEMLHCTYAFHHLNVWAYREVVAEKNNRPRIDKSLSSRVQGLIKESWDRDPNKRPTFKSLSLLLKSEYQEIVNDTEPGKVSRSQHLMDSSARSFDGVFTSVFESRRSLKGGKDRKKIDAEC